MKKQIFIFFLFILILSCKETKKNLNIFEAKEKDIYFSLELPCRDENVIATEKLIKKIQKEQTSKASPLYNITFAKLKIKNLSKLYLNTDKYSLKIFCKLKGKEEKQGVIIDKIFDLINYDISKKGLKKIIPYDRGSNEYLREDFIGNKLKITIGTKETAIIKFEELVKIFANLAKEKLPSYLIVKLEKEVQENSNNEEELNKYIFAIKKKNSEIVEAHKLIEEITDFQKTIRGKMENSVKDVLLYNKYVEIYNKLAEISNEILLKQKEERCVFYYFKDIMAEDIESLIIEGGDYNKISEELLNKMRKNDNMPLSPNSEALIYYGFINLDRKKIENIYIKIDEYKLELK